MHIGLHDFDLIVDKPSLEQILILTTYRDMG